MPVHLGGQTVLTQSGVKHTKVVRGNQFSPSVANFSIYCQSFLKVFQSGRVIAHVSVDNSRVVQHVRRTLTVASCRVVLQRGLVFLEGIEVLASFPVDLAEVVEA